MSESRPNRVRPTNLQSTNTHFTPVNTGFFVGLQSDHLADVGGVLGILPVMTHPHSFAVTDDLLDLREAARLPVFRRNGKPVSIPQLHRYILDGARAPDGRRVRLAVVRTPRGRKTSLAAVEQFIAALQGEPIPDISPAPPASRRKAIREAEAELEAAGFGDAIGGAR